MSQNKPQSSRDKPQSSRDAPSTSQEKPQSSRDAPQSATDKSQTADPQAAGNAKPANENESQQAPTQKVEILPIPIGTGDGITPQVSGTEGKIRSRRSMALIAIHAADEVDHDLDKGDDKIDNDHEYAIGEGPDDI